MEREYKKPMPIYSVVETRGAVRDILLHKGNNYFDKTSVKDQIRLMIRREQIPKILVDIFETQHIKNNNIDRIISASYHTRPLVNIGCRTIRGVNDYASNICPQLELIARKFVKESPSKYFDFKVVIPRDVYNVTEIEIYDWGSKRSTPFNRIYEISNGEAEINRLFKVINLIADEIVRTEQYNKYNV